MGDELFKFESFIKYFMKEFMSIKLMV